MTLRADDNVPLPEPRALASRGKRQVVVAGIVAAVLATGGVVAWWQPWAPEFEPASIERMAYPLPDNPSIAMLPFDNYADDPRMNYFASGLTEDLASALSKVRALFVIARNSAAKLKGGTADVKQVAEELGIQYVLEESVQKAGDRLRITTQLINAISGDQSGHNATTEKRLTFLHCRTKSSRGCWSRSV